jgi:hypothetical protein
MNNRVPLPAGTTLGKSFEYGFDVNLGTYGSPLFQPLRRMSAFAPTFPEVTGDVATYDDLGSPNEAVDGRGVVISLTVQGNRNVNTGLYLPELALLLDAAKATGEAAIIDGRWYHKPEVGTPNPNDAGRASFRVSATRVNTGNTGTEVWNITLTGVGSFERIVNPFAGWGATAPVVTSVMPPEAAEGELVTIAGAGFLTVTGITVDGAAVPAKDYVIGSGGQIVLAMPAGDEGVVPIVVTNPAGSSAPLAYDRGA